MKNIINGISFSNTKSKIGSIFYSFIMACIPIILITGVSPLYAQMNDQNIEDSDITKAIETDLWIDENVNMNTINVETNQGVVTLVGTAENILMKERAAKIAGNIVGVRAIINLINVKPNKFFTNKELENAIKKALLRDPATESYDVNINVNNGTVILDGKVDSWQEMELTENVVKSVKGVREVKNNISVEFKTERPDYEIKQEIIARLANDVRVDDFQIEVAVEDGEVDLSGSVGSIAEKNVVLHDSWVAGVKLVRTDDLNIEWWERDKMRRKSLYEKRDDEEIKKALEAAFLFDPRVMSFNPQVDVNGGTVILKGTVDNLKAKSAAEEDAKNVVGVLWVKNHLQVQPLSIPTDEELKKQIEGALISDIYVNRFDVDVNVSHGLVYLSGNVNTNFEKSRAESVTEGIRGVVDVFNNIEYKYEWTWKKDSEIKNNVEEQLRWSLYVDADDINVTVENGVVTLNGEVNTWGEYNTAEKNAFEGGAKDVQNNLTILNPMYYGPYGRYPFWVPSPLN